jgi:hypothetical protein
MRQRRRPHDDTHLCRLRDLQPARGRCGVCAWPVL